MPHHIVLLGAVTLLGVLEQAYFALQVIAARRKYSVSPPSTSGPPEFDRIFRAQVNCTEYFPMFLAVLWLAGIFFHQALEDAYLGASRASSHSSSVSVRMSDSRGTASVCGILYLLARYNYFQGYSASPKERLGPMYLNAAILWLLIGLSAAGILHELLSHYLGLKII